jgi:hypothetical protein
MAELPHLHQEYDLQAGDVVDVVLNRPANVQLLASEEYEKYLRGETFRYQGGYAREFPFQIKAPRAGRWHLVVDLGGGPGMVTGDVGIASYVSTGPLKSAQEAPG